MDINTPLSILVPNNYLNENPQTKLSRKKEQMQKLHAALPVSTGGSWRMFVLESGSAFIISLVVAFSLALRVCMGNISKPSWVLSQLSMMVNGVVGGRMRRYSIAGLQETWRPLTMQLSGHIPVKEHTQAEHIVKLLLNIGTSWLVKLGPLSAYQWFCISGSSCNRKQFSREEAREVDDSHAQSDSPSKFRLFFSKKVDVEVSKSLYHSVVICDYHHGEYNIKACGPGGNGVIFVEYET